MGSWHNSEKITSSFWDSISLSLKRKEGEKVGLDGLLDLSPTVSPFQECSKRLSKTLNNLLVANTITITNIIPILQKRKQRIRVTFPRLQRCQVQYFPNYVLTVSHHTPNMDSVGKQTVETWSAWSLRTEPQQRHCEVLHFKPRKRHLFSKFF